MVAIPITFEQPGTAVRLHQAATGEVIPVAKLSRAKLRSAI